MDALALLQPEVLGQLDRLSKELAQSNLIPDALKGKPRDILVTLMTGAELGLAPMQSVRSINVIKGKPSLSADLMVSLVKQRKDVCESLDLITSTNEVCTYRAKRVGEKPVEMSFTMEDARQAQLTSSAMYQKFPKNMLRARCASNICKAVWPDICMGLYDSDSGELTDGRVTEKDVTPAAPVVSLSGPEAVRAALGVAQQQGNQNYSQSLAAKAPLIVDVKPGETEDAASARAKAVMASSGVALKPEPAKAEYADLSMDEIAERVMQGEEWLQKNAKNPKRAEMQAKLTLLQAEMLIRRMEHEVNP